MGGKDLFAHKGYICLFVDRCWNPVGHHMRFHPWIIRDNFFVAMSAPEDGIWEWRGKTCFFSKITLQSMASGRKNLVFSEWNKRSPQHRSPNGKLLERLHLIWFADGRQFESRKSGGGGQNHCPEFKILPDFLSENIEAYIIRLKWSRIMH